MRVESLASRLDFSERRVRALEGVVQYRPEAVRPPRDRRPMRPGRDRHGPRAKGSATPADAIDAAGAAAARHRRSGASSTGRRRPPAPARAGAAGAAQGWRPAQPRAAGGEPTGDADADATPADGELQDDADADCRCRRERSRRPTTRRRTIDGAQPTTSARDDRERRLRDPTSSEDRDRRPALRRRHQRRRRAARALHRRASRPARAGRGADDVRDRLRHVAQRAAGAAPRRSTASRCAAFRSRANAIRTNSGARSERVFTQTHSLRDELSWLDAEGPTSPELIAYIRAARADASTSSSSSASATTTRIHGARAVPGKAILVPTAERDGALGLAHFRAHLPRRPRAHVQLVRGARAHSDGVSGNTDVPGVVVGVGSEIPDAEQAPRASARSSTSAIGSRSTSAASTRTRAARELFDFFQRYSADDGRGHAPGAHRHADHSHSRSSAAFTISGS